MAFAQIHFFANTLGVSTAMNVLLPQPTSEAQFGMGGAARRERYPVLYLLHGWSDDESIWMRRTAIERHAAQLPLIVVMPRVELSMYQNTHSGMAFWDFISEEVPALCRHWFPVSERREDTFVAGLSMGGYGAFRLALTHPGRFAAAASLSGGLDIAHTVSTSERRLNREAKIDAIFHPDTEIKGSNSDLFHLAGRLSPGEKGALRLYQCCGAEDFLYTANTCFRDHAIQCGLNLTYEEGPGSHEWGYWDQQIQRVLEWLPIER